LIVVTAVAEEGLDIQACCNVVRWATEHGQLGAKSRARQKLSSSVLMLSDSLAFEPIVRKWKELEKEMSNLYNTRSEYQVPHVEDEDADEDGSLRCSVDATG
jgi:endoribonuclease Dicer